MSAAESGAATRIGLGMVEFPFEDVGSLWQWVDLCEDGGIDAIWHCDRLIAREPYMEVMTFLAALAGRTERLRLGMDVVVVPFRDPLVLAKQCATIDYLSGGRLCAGFGVGPATVPEWSATGRPTTARGARTDEALLLMRRLWSEESVTHEGRFFHYENATITPRPVQQPLPIWIGGRSDAAVRRIAQIGSGWFSGLATAAQIAPVIDAIGRACEAAGRPFPAENYGADFAVHIGDSDDAAVRHNIEALRGFTTQAPEEFIAVGSVEDVVARIEAFRAVGVRTFALRPLAATDAGLLEQTRRIIDEIVPRYATASGG